MMCVHCHSHPAKAAYGNLYCGYHRSEYIVYLNNKNEKRYSEMLDGQKRLEQLIVNTAKETQQVVVETAQETQDMLIDDFVPEYSFAQIFPPSQSNFITSSYSQPEANSKRVSVKKNSELAKRNEVITIAIRRQARRRKVEARRLQLDEID